MLISRSMTIVLTATLLISASVANAQRGRQGAMRNRAAVNVSRLDVQTRNAILSALDDERKAKAFYGAVLAKYGEIRPFSNIVNAEARHESALAALLTKYGIEVPADAWASRKIDVPSTLQATFPAAIKLEQENIALYDGFLKFVKEEDIKAVMSQLQWASQERHLPAFQRRAGGMQGRGQAPTAQAGVAMAQTAIPQVGPGRGLGAGRMGCCCGACLLGAQSAGTAASAGQVGGRGMGWQGGQGAGRGPGWMGGQGQGRGWRGGRGQ